MPEYHPGFRDPLGPGRADIVLSDHLQHGRTAVAGERGEAGQRRHQNRQRQVAGQVQDLPREGQLVEIQGAQARDGDEPELQAQADHEEEGHPERRRGEAEVDEEGRRPVEEGVLLHRGPHPDRDGRDEYQPEGEEVQEEGRGQALGDLADHRPVVLEGVAEVEQGHALEPAGVLDRPGPVEAVELDEALLRLRRHLDVQVREHVRRLSRREPHHEEGEERDPQDQRDEEEHPADEVGGHGAFTGPL